MLPMPGAASSSWSLYRSRILSLFEQINVRTAFAFWLLGLVNNVLYVVILSAALDLVGPSIPKSLVLLFDVVPSFLLKLTAPYYIHVVPYRIRVLLLVMLSTCGMLIIALTATSLHANPGRDAETPKQREILIKMSGVVLASLSSGLGELSFLGLTSYYGPTSLAAWGSGTGGAGLIGAGAYLFATTGLGLSVRSTLLTSALLPLFMLFSFFVVLPGGMIKKDEHSYERVDEDDIDGQRSNHESEEGLLSQSDAAREGLTTISKQSAGPWLVLKANLRRARGLLMP